MIFNSEKPAILVCLFVCFSLAIINFSLTKYWLMFFPSLLVNAMNNSVGVSVGREEQAVVLPAAVLLKVVDTMVPFR